VRIETPLRTRGDWIGTTIVGKSEKETSHHRRTFKRENNRGEGNFPNKERGRKGRESIRSRDIKKRKKNQVSNQGGATFERGQEDLGKSEEMTKRLLAGQRWFRAPLGWPPSSRGVRARYLTGAKQKRGEFKGWDEDRAEGQV